MMLHTEMRRATADDAATVRDVTRAAYTRWIPIIGREPGPMTADYDLAVRENMIDVVVDNGEIVALIGMVDEGECLLVKNVAVAPAYQGQGLGQQMLHHADELAMRRSLPRLRLYTNKLFEENIRLYLCVGYVIDREEDFWGGRAVYMSKRIGAAKDPEVS